LRKSLQQFETDLQKFPHDTGKLRMAHQLYIELNLPHQCLESIARIGPASTEHYGMAAMAHQLLGSSNPAVEDYCALALKKDMKNFWAILALLELYQAQGRYGEGLRAMR
jgi:hypothetical protein